MKKCDFEIIDCHIHPYLNEKTDLTWFDRFSPDDFVMFMKKVGIKRACGSTILKDVVATCTFKEIHEMNIENLRFRDKYPDFFIPGIHIHPDYPQESCEEVEHLYKTEGVRWVGELVGYLTNYKTYISVGAFEIFALLEKLKVPVNIHTFSMDEIAEIAVKFPDLNIVVAHLDDGKNSLIDRIAYMVKYRNVYLDISASGPHRWGILRYAIDMAGKDKFLLGSDFPICNPAVFIASVLSESLTDEERFSLFSGNFKRLTGLQ